MPYIPEERRDHLDTDSVARNKGELTFEITRLIDAYHDHHQDNFDTRGDIVAALECSKYEFYFRIVSPYEKIKREENGDVYDAHRSPSVRHLEICDAIDKAKHPQVWKYHPQNHPDA